VAGGKRLIDRVVWLHAWIMWWAIGAELTFVISATIDHFYVPDRWLLWAGVVEAPFGLFCWWRITPTLTTAIHRFVDSKTKRP
jgi:hypothetical protein